MLPSTPLQRKRLTLPRWVVFFFGLSLTTNVVYLFKVGNTAVPIGYVVAVPLALALLYAGRREWDDLTGSVDRSVWLFCGLAAISLCASLVLAISGVIPENTPLVVLRGLVVLFCGLAVYVVCVSSRLDASCLLAGIGLGIVINGVLSFVAQRAFDSGSYFSLYSLFPQESFAICAPWEIWGQLPAGSGRLTTFRPQGLFLETSHLMVFLVCFVPLAFLASKNNLLRSAIAVAAVYCAIASLSPNTLFLLVEVVILLFMTRKRESTHRVPMRLRHSTILLMVFLAFCLLLVLFMNPEIVIRAYNLLSEGISDINVSNTTDDGTLERLAAMFHGLEVAFHYPFGTGWNTESLILQFWFGNAVPASHSYAVRLMIELGVAGLFAYVYMIYRHAAPLLGDCAPRSDLALGVAVAFLCICQVTNGTALLPWTWALLGLAHGRCVRIRRGCIDGEQTDCDNHV